MGVIDRFEKGIERAVNGAFAKAFRSEVQPVEIASALRRELDDRAAIVARDRTLAPNVFVVELGDGDHARLADLADTLGNELRHEVQTHAGNQRYTFVGPVQVSFEKAADLDTGLFRVRSSSVAGPSRAAAPARPAQAPRPAAPSPPARSMVDRRDGVPPPGVSAPPVPAAGPVPPTSAPPTSAPPTSTPPRSAARPSAPSTHAASGQLWISVDGRRQALTNSVTVIGRGPEADVVLDDPGISRRHAEIHLLDDHARLIDLGSTNGTFVDGERIHARALSDGSTITVGRTRIVFHRGGA